MSLAVLIPYRPDSFQRQRIQKRTAELWRRTGAELIYSDDGLTGLFSFARAVNRARTQTESDYLLIYNTDALPLPVNALAEIEQRLKTAPWMVLFDGQQHFTEVQTEHLLAGYEPYQVGPPAGPKAMGREALYAIRADVFDGLRGMDERFVGWGPEDTAFHKVLSIVHPNGIDTPPYGLFHSLWHPDTPRTRWNDNVALWLTYGAHHDPNTMRTWYLDRP